MLTFYSTQKGATTTAASSNLLIAWARRSSISTVLGSGWYSLIKSWASALTSLAKPTPPRLTRLFGRRRITWDRQALHARVASCVLRRKCRLGAEFVCRMPDPVRVVEKAAGQRHHIRLSGADDRFRLTGLSDLPYGHRFHARFAADISGEPSLVPGAGIDVLQGRITAR